MDKTKKFVTEILSSDDGKKLVTDINGLSNLEYEVLLDFMRFALPRVLSGQDPQQVLKAWKEREEEQ
jgi:hypothetical protein